MRCSNCDTPIPRGATSCPNCGVYALDEPPTPPAPPRRMWWPLAAVVAVALVAGGGWWWWSRTTPPPRPKVKPDPVHVVRDRPGGNIAEAEAIRMLRRHLTSREVPSECVVVMSNGLHGGAYELKAFDRCKQMSLGPWRVDAKTHEVKMR